MLRILAKDTSRTLDVHTLTKVSCRHLGLGEADSHRTTSRTPLSFNVS